MSISDPFIQRPIATTLLTIGLVIAGVVAFRELPVAALPQVDYPTIVVSTQLPGASAETMASSVTTPLERQFGQVPSMAQMTSVSSQGSSQITLQFELDRSIDSAEQDVQAAINAATSVLPATLPAPPTYSKSNPADAPILTIALSSDSLSLPEVNDQADSVLAQKISQVPGVGLVTLNGAQKPAVRIQVDPSSLAGTNLTLEDVRTAIVAANVNQPKGTIDGPRQAYTLAADDQLTSAAQFKPLVLAWRNGSPIRLQDVASVKDGVENDALAGWANEKRAIILNVQRQPGANVIEVADRVKALLPQLEASLPQGLQVHVLSDRTETVRASVEDVEFTLALTIGLVVLVIYAFLRNWRATLIPSITVPLSLVGTFGLMYLFGFSLNNLSLMALTISTGFVVDDAIVMLENIARYVEEGEAPLAAAKKGARQIGFTIVSLTVSLIAVLIPLLFMGGLIGRLFREFAITLSAAIAVSAVLSLTLTPTMAAHLLKPEPPPEQRGTFYKWSEAAFEWMLAWYKRGLVVVFRHQTLTLLVTVATIALTVVLTIVIPKGFFPIQDTGSIIGVTEGPNDASFARMVELQEQVIDVVRKDPGVADVAAFIGADGTNPTTNSGRLNITLKPRGDRDDDAEAIITRLNERLGHVTGISVFLQAAQDLQLDNRLSRTQFQYTLESADGDELERTAPALLERMAQLPELRDVTSDAQQRGPVTRLMIDRDTAARLGIATRVIDDTLYDAFGQRQISTIFTQLNLYRVILEVTPSYAGDADSLSSLFVKSADGTPIALSQIVRIEHDDAPLVLSHQGQFRSITISFNVAPGTSLGQAVDAIERVREQLDMPPSVHSTMQGAARAFRDSLASEPLLILAALITVYIVLGVLYESFIHPITILSTLPSAGVGAYLALIVCGADFSVIALIGIVLLIGIVKKNAIMMIDFALEAERDHGKSPEESIFEACLLRFRPIMMTTMAALLGGVPLAFGSGTGSELRRPLGITIVGGLLVSQVLTLYTTPIIYLFMDRLSQRLGTKKTTPSRAQEALS